MEGPCRVSKCPIFCILKAVVVALLTIFVLFCPIGDPAELCNNTNKSRNQNIPLICLCEFYIETIKLFNKTKEVTELVVCRALDLLYEAKLKFYAVLNKVDGSDLYQSVCCKDSEVSVEDAEQQQLACKCTRKCCSCRKKNC
ncbi:uncharacterized protein LOC126773041 [Nymphalis io]|uniref:uncharacterized protein LOC126773041 n=1 Tax=Inachis io TaxID=171585 RepID=UPI0021696D4F|nr:uncharacterized protein LOC126773041 [Nymphalis io]